MNTQPTTLEQALARIQELEAKKAPSASIKVSSKGGVSVYGLGRFPVTLYASQWAKLISKAQDIVNFIDVNQDKLAVKGDA